MATRDAPHGATYYIPRARRLTWYGGQSDIARASTGEEIFEAIQEAWSVPLSRGGKVLALTIPQTKVKVAWVTGKRDEINDNILSHSEPNV